jgi:hypothetical protein
LAEHYVCVYVDTEQSSGENLASAFDISEGPAVVISDPTGSVQAFRHEGELTNQKLGQYLRRYADPERKVDSTETVATQRVSYYPQQAVTPPPVFSPPFMNFAPTMGGARGGC